MELIKSKRSGLLLTVLLIALSAVVIPQAFAQDTVIRFVGVVEAQSATSLTVNGVVFDTSRAHVKPNVTVGSTVMVKARMVNDTFMAFEVHRMRGDVTFGEIELVGVVEAFDGATITLAGRTLNLANAQVGPNIAVGRVVEVHLVQSGETTWTVSEVHLDDDDDDDADRYEIVGRLDEIGLGYIVVAGQRIEVTDARLEGFLILGTQVEVEFVIQNGVWSAIEIESEIDDDFDDDDDDDDDDWRDLIIVPIGPNCAAQTPEGWTTYAIQRGDTLSGLALRTGASLEQLVSVNCLINSGRLVVDTMIAVPRTPDPAIIIRGDRDDDRHWNQDQQRNHSENRNRGGRGGDERSSSESDDSSHSDSDSD